MGLLSIVKDVVKTAAIITIGGPIAAPFIVADKLGIIDLDGTPKLDESTTTTQVEDISKVLEDIKREPLEVASKNEGIYKDHVNKCFNDTIKLFEKEDLAKNFSIEHLKRKQKDLIERMKIDGSLTEQLDERLSIDNEECREILGMDSGEDRNRKMIEFINRVIEDSSNELINRVTNALNEQKDEITTFLADQIDEEERNARTAAKEFERWEKDMQTNSFNQEQAQLQPKVKLYAIEQIEKIMAA